MTLFELDASELYVYNVGMYLRRIARRRKDGSEVAYFQLARKVRDQQGRPRDEILYHFGRAEAVGEDQLRRLVKSIGRFLSPAERTRRPKSSSGWDATAAIVLARQPLNVPRNWIANACIVAVAIGNVSERGSLATRKFERPARRARAIRSRPFDLIRDKKLIETTADDLRAVITAGGAFTNHFLRCLHNLALGLGWLLSPVIPPKLWPKARKRPKRGITWEEHQRIVQNENNEERKLYYELLWEIGAAQTDAAKAA